jgi:hypothetical protein
VGTLRFDINTVSERLPKATKKEVQALKKDFFAEVRSERASQVAC